MKRLLVMLGVLAAATLPPASAQAPAAHPLTFAEPVVLAGSSEVETFPPSGRVCNTGCAEPMMAIAPDGTVYVSAPRALLLCCNTKASPIWRSTDGGRSFSAPFAPDPSVAVGNALTGGDTAMVVDKRGYLYVSELWLGNDTMFISKDRGQTWDWTPASHPEAYVDREWLVYSAVDDAIWGIFNGPLGTSMIRADVGNGSEQARFFDEWWPGEIPNGGTVPIPSVDPRNGTLYVPFRSLAGTGNISVVGVTVTQDDGKTWVDRQIPGQRPVFLNSNFIVSAVDAAGTVYVSWVESVGGNYTVMLASSRDAGLTWRGPTAISTARSRTAIFPAIAAGAAGRVALGWFGTDDAAGNPNKFPTGTSWDVHLTTIIDAETATPAIHHSIVDEDFHRGSIWTVESADGDRSLLDFFDVKIHPGGALLTTYTRDKGAGTEVVVARQTEGCNLLVPGAYVGPGVPQGDGGTATRC